MATSNFTLPVAIVLATLAWLTESGNFVVDGLCGWALALFMVYLLEEMNNVNSLIRIRTRMTATVYMIGVGCCGFMHAFRVDLLVVPAVMLACYLLFRTYQQYQPVAGTFHAFLCLGLGMLIYPRLVGLIPFFLFCMAVYLRTLSFRTFRSALIGLVLPFWFAAAWTLYVDKPAYWLGIWSRIHWTGLPELSSYASLTSDRQAAWGGLTFFMSVAIVRYFNFNCSDKIRTRMLFHMLILLHVCVQVWVIMCPEDFDALYGLLLASSAPLLAHMCALDRTRTVSVLFVTMSVWSLTLLMLSL
ncbi:MAG: hypothetical protein NC388_04055 [Clostridium sp.]|nr:hypothetical protein [Clostridium sp.]